MALGGGELPYWALLGRSWGNFRRLLWRLGAVLARSRGQDGGQDGTDIQNFAIQFRLAISDATSEGLRGAGTSDGGSTVAENGWAGRGGVLTEPDSGGIWHVVSYAVHQSRTDAADPTALRAIPATVPVCWRMRIGSEVY